MSSFGAAGEAVGAEEVGASVVASVVPAGVLGVEALERDGEVVVVDADERVVMGVEQDVGEDIDAACPAGGAEALEEVGSVVVVVVEAAAVAAVRGEVVDPGRELPRSAGHEPERTATGGSGEPVGDELFQTCNTLAIDERFRFTPVSDTEKPEP